MIDYLPNYACPPVEGPLSWQPIESAPKDGRQLLLWFPGVGSLGTMVTAFWYLDAGKVRPKPHWRQTGSQSRLCPEKWSPYRASRLDQPTHWMPLPAGPARGAKETDSQDLVWHPQFGKPAADESLQHLADKMRSYSARKPSV